MSGAESLISVGVLEMFYDDNMEVDPVKRSIPISSPRTRKLFYLILNTDYDLTEKKEDNDEVYFIRELRRRKYPESSITLYDRLLHVTKSKQKNPIFPKIYRLAALVFLIIHSLTELPENKIKESVKTIVEDNMSGFRKNYGGMAHDIHKLVSSNIPV